LTRSISWLQQIARTDRFQHFKPTISTQSYGNSGLRQQHPNQTVSHASSSVMEELGRKGVATVGLSLTVVRAVRSPSERYPAILAAWDGNLVARIGACHHGPHV